MKRLVNFKLHGGQVVKVGFSEKLALKKALLAQDPKRIARATFALLASSKEMIDDLTARCMAINNQMIADRKGWGINGKRLRLL